MPRGPGLELGRDLEGLPLFGLFKKIEECDLAVVARGIVLAPRVPAAMTRK
jgi:hypothetical protein